MTPFASSLKSVRFLQSCTALTDQFGWLRIQTKLTKGSRLGSARDLVWPRRRPLCKWKQSMDILVSVMQWSGGGTQSLKLGSTGWQTCLAAVCRPWEHHRRSNRSDRLSSRTNVSLLPVSQHAPNSLWGQLTSCSPKISTFKRSLQSGYPTCSLKPRKTGGSACPEKLCKELADKETWLMWFAAMRRGSTPGILHRSKPTHNGLTQQLKVNQQWWGGNSPFPRWCSLLFSMSKG